MPAPCRLWRRVRAPCCRPLRILVTLAALLVGWVSSLPAHQELLRAQPRAGQQLSVVPVTVRLFYREPLPVAFTRVMLFDADGVPVRLGDLRIEGDSATVAAAAILEPLAPGRYTVRWRTTGVDGHAVEGSHTFSVLAGAIPTPVEAGPDAAAEGTAAPATLPAESTTLTVGSWPYVAVRWFNFLALFGVLGAVLFRFGVLPRFTRTAAGLAPQLSANLARDVSQIGRYAVITVLLMGGARLWAQAATMLGPSEPLTLQWLKVLLGTTVWGRAWLLQGLGAILVWFGLGRAVHGLRGSAGVLTLLGTVLLAIVPALSGHAIATPSRSVIAVTADSLHVLAAGGWVGGVAVLLLVGLMTILRGPLDRRAASVAGLVEAFSPVALILGGLVVLSGVVGAWLHLDHVSALWLTPYGRTLSLKLILVAVLFGLGALNFLRVRPSLGNPEGAGRLRRSAGWELTVGVAVLLITAVLVALPPRVGTSPMSAHTPAPVTPIPPPED